jgi:hypothetical protein
MHAIPVQIKQTYGESTTNDLRIGPPWRSTLCKYHWPNYRWGLMRVSLVPAGADAYGSVLQRAISW